MSDSELETKPPAGGSGSSEGSEESESPSQSGQEEEDLDVELLFGASEPCGEPEASSVEPLKTFSDWAVRRQPQQQQHEQEQEQEQEQEPEPEQMACSPLDPATSTATGAVPVDQSTQRRMDRRLRDRSRAQQKKQMLEEMRQQVRQLQSQFDELTQQLDESSWSPQEEAFWGDLSHFEKANVSPQSIVKLALEAQQLRRENEQYKRRIRDRELFSNSIRTIQQFDGVDAASASSPSSSSSSSSEAVPRVIGHASHSRADYAKLRYIPYTLQQCNELIRSSLEFGAQQWHVHARRNGLLGKKAQELCMGWQGTRVLEGDALFFCQSTRLEHLDPASLSNVCWRMYCDVDKYRQAFAQPVYIKILQLFEDKAVIFRRITTNLVTGKRNHSVHMIYRARYGDELLIGMRALPLYGNGRSNVAGDEMGHSLLQDDGNETAMTMHYWNCVGLPNASTDPQRTAEGDNQVPDNESKPVASVMRRWGSLSFERQDDADFWEQEFMDASIRFQRLLISTGQ